MKTYEQRTAFTTICCARWCFAPYVFWAFLTSCSCCSCCTAVPLPLHILPAHDVLTRTPDCAGFLPARIFAPLQTLYLPDLLFTHFILSVEGFIYCNVVLDAWKSHLTCRHSGARRILPPGGDGVFEHLPCVLRAHNNTWRYMCVYASNRHYCV